MEGIIEHTHLLLVAVISLLLIFIFFRQFFLNKKLQQDKLQIESIQQNQLRQLNELKCLNHLSTLSDTQSSIDEYLHSAVQIFPEVCEQSDYIAHLIEYKDKEYKPPEFEKFEKVAHQHLIVNDEIQGKLHLALARDIKPKLKTHLLKNEYPFLQILAKQLQNVLILYQSRDTLRLSASVFEHTNDAIIITDLNANILSVNQAFCTLTGYGCNEVIGKKPSILQSGYHDKNFYQKMWKQLKDKGSWSGLLRNKRKNGEVYIEQLSITSIHQYDGQTSKYLGIFSDVTKDQKQHEKLQFLAHHDPLTQLPNRLLFQDRLKTSIAQVRRNDMLLGIVFLDLDGFKPVNDNYGHDAGDQLLIEISKRMMLSIREGDSIARIGGDEFAIILSNLYSIDECQQILNRLLKHISEPVSLNKAEVMVSASIGATLFPIDDNDMDTLLNHADQAMYLAKSSGKNCFHLYNYEQDSKLQSRHESVIRIKRAMTDEEFRIFYQPIIDLKTGKVLSMETFLYWQHPHKGLLNSDEFIHHINDNELSLQIDYWIIKQAMAQVQQWKEAGMSIKLSVNLSMSQLYDVDFSFNLGKIMASFSKVTSDDIDFEIIEAIALDNFSRNKTNLNYCRKMGYKLILDDFGSGYSSINCFKRMSLDGFKIDHHYVSGMLKSDQDYTIVDAIINLGHSFQYPIIANGIETIEHGQILIKMGCQLGQGSIISEPLASSDVIDWVNNFQLPGQWQHSEDFIWNKEDLPFLLVEKHHSAWIERMLSFLEQDTISIDDAPTLSHRKCYFGRWYYQVGMKNYGELDEFKLLGPLHKQVHEQGKILCDLKIQKKHHQIKEKIDELIELKKQMLYAVDKLHERVKEINKNTSNS